MCVQTGDRACSRPSSSRYTASLRPLTSTSRPSPGGTAAERALGRGESIPHEMRGHVQGSRDHAPARAERSDASGRQEIAHGRPASLERVREDPRRQGALHQAVSGVARRDEDPLGERAASDVRQAVGRLEVLGRPPVRHGLDGEPRSGVVLETAKGREGLLGRMTGLVVLAAQDEELLVLAPEAAHVVVRLRGVPEQRVRHGVAEAQGDEVREVRDELGLHQAAAHRRVRGEHEASGRDRSAIRLELHETPDFLEAAHPGVLEHLAPGVLDAARQADEVLHRMEPAPGPGRGRLPRPERAAACDPCGRPAGPGCGPPRPRVRARPPARRSPPGGRPAPWPSRTARPFPPRVPA